MSCRIVWWEESCIYNVTIKRNLTVKNAIDKSSPDKCFLKGRVQKTKRETPL